jgi:DNA repair exonuclease SbcCD ATPase subunit
MMPSARLIRIEFEAFRGFASSQRLDLDADVVLVRGDNGTGKTSVADGLLWLFTGELVRLAERARGLRKGQDPIVNRYRGDGPARVRLTCSTSDGRTVEFEREGNASASRLAAWHDGSEVVDAQGLLGHTFGDLTHAQLSQAVASWGILQQNSIVAALDSGAAMHQRLAEVVGLERVTRFADSASEVARRAAGDRKRILSVQESLRKQSSSATSRLSEVRKRTRPRKNEQQRIASLVETAVEGLPKSLTVRVPSSLDELAAVQREVDAIVQLARDVAAATGEGDRSSNEQADAVEGLQRELEQLRARADDATRDAPVQVQLANAALEVLRDDECPVCGQPIDPASVRKHLTEVLQQAEQDRAVASELRDAVASTQSRLQAARLAEERRAVAEQRVARVVDRMRLAQDDASWIGFEASWAQPEKASMLADELAKVRDPLRNAYVEAQRETPEEIARISSEVEASGAELERADAELADANVRCDRATSLDRAAHRAAETIVRRALDRLAPSFAEVFDRLAPHPTFRELRATQDFFYGKNHVVPEVYDPVHKISGNPALMFSEGQLNVVALSYFLGLALNAGEATLPFIVLDDPVQSMDVLSVLGFADLCRRLRDHRQLVLTTHDRRFASLLGRKLAPRQHASRTLLHEFTGWTEEGPQVQTTEEPFSDVIPLLARRAS